MSDLTKIQQKVFKFIQDTLEKGSAPTMREVAERFGWKSKRAAQKHIEALIRKGFLVSDPGKARSIKLVHAVKALAQTVVEIPLLGFIPAGHGSDSEQESDGCIRVTVESLGFKPTQNTFALQVVGDSMIGKHICDGDIAIFEHGPEPRSGQIVAALIDRKDTLKTFVIKNGKAFLKAENPKYPDLIPSEELVIHGVFRSLVRRAKS